MKKIFVLTLFFILSPVFAEAQVFISEIMYNLEGTDTGFEWIEICNPDSENVDLSNWKLFENQTNHKISAFPEGENTILSSNSCGVIADDPNKFKQNNSGFNGLLLDSAFSLSNSGETLILRNSDLEDIYNVSYTPEIGANGDGNSLQLSNDDWIASSPSVGLTNDSHSSPVSVEKPVSQNLSVAQEESLMKQNIIVDFGKDRKVIAGADVLFKAVAVGLEKEPLKNARYVWSMGDGSKKEGESVLYTYKYPGQYVVFLTVTSGIYSATDRIIVEAMPADVIISQVNFADGFLELYNRSNYELDLSWWII